MSQIESFSTTQLPRVIPSYLYQEYADDDDLQAFVDAQNALAQGYHDWFLQTPLGLYIAPSINGALLDWIGQGVYGIARPVLSTQSSRRVAGYNEYSYNTFPYNGLNSSVTGTAQIASDDIYKRVLTWHLYKGDGYQFSMLWLKKRIARFLNGVNGMDFPVLDALPSITVSGSTFTVDEAYSQSLVFLEQCISNNVLALPFQYSVVINALTLVNNGGVLVVVPFMGYPANSAGLPPGAIYSDGGVVAVVPGITPNPAAPPVFFGSINSDELLALGGGNLPFSLTPITATNQLFGTGNGSTSTFQLSIGGLPIQSGITVTSIFRSDWQGNQLLYATARINTIKNSNNLSGSTTTNCTLATSAGVGPDGLNTYAIVTATATSAPQVTMALISAPVLDASGNFNLTIAIEDVNSGFVCLQLNQQAGATVLAASAINFNLTTGVWGSDFAVGGNPLNGFTNLHAQKVSGWWYLSYTVTPKPGATSYTPYVGPASSISSRGGTIGGAINVFGPTDCAGGIIITTTSAVTVTDYSVGSTGLIPLGQVPVTGAQLTWNGSGIQSGTGQLWNNGGVVCIA